MEEMKNTILPVQRDGAFCYSIVLERSFEELSGQLKALDTDGRRICIVTDSQVGPLYGELVREKGSTTGLPGESTN